MKASRLLLLLLDIAIAGAAGAAAWVLLIGPIETSVTVRSIHWDDPMRPLWIAIACGALRLAAPLAGLAWRRVGARVAAVARHPVTIVAVALVAIAAWLVAGQRARGRAAEAGEAQRSLGWARVGLVTRPVLGLEEPAAGVVLPALGAGGAFEIACGASADAARFLGRGSEAPSARVILRGPSGRVLRAGPGAASAGEGAGDAAAGGVASPAVETAPGTHAGGPDEGVRCVIEAGRWNTVVIPVREALPAGSRLFVAPEGESAEEAADLILYARPAAVPPPDPARPNIILISIDTLRADHLGAYGYARPVSPAIDDLAARGVLFERAVAPSPWTTPSHMSLFTSLYPTVHAVDAPTTVRQRRLDDGRRTLAEALSEAGWLTAAFTGSGSISSHYGFWQGFTLYDETERAEGPPATGDIAAIFGKASRWLVDHHRSPFFLFLHTYEVHAPYIHDTFLGQAADGEGGREAALYDGGILHTDGFVGQLVNLVDGLGIRDRTIIVLLSDHGEELAPRYPGKPLRHGHTLYEDLLRVPLIVSAPPPALAGHRVGGMVQLIDVMPTLLELAGVAPPEGIQGVSLAASLAGGEPPVRSAFSEATNYGPERKAVQDGRFKYIRLFERQEAPARDIPVAVPPEELFDLAADPLERRSLLDAAPEALGRLKAEMEALTKLNLGLRGGSGEIELSAEEIERLRALGYIQ